MPDTKIFVDGQSVDNEVKELLLNHVPSFVAECMSCWVYSWSWRKPFRFRSFYKLSTSEVDVVIFWDKGQGDDVVDVFSNTQIIVEVAAYSFFDRRRSISRRIEAIANRIKSVASMPQNEDYNVTITFIPIKKGYWARA